MILAKNTIWQTFETIITTNDQRWYCLGGSIWIKYDAELMTMLDKKPAVISEHDTPLRSIYHTRSTFAIMQ